MGKVNEVVNEVVRLWGCGYRCRALSLVLKGELVKKFMNKHPDKRPHRRTIKAEPNKMARPMPHAPRCADL